MSKLNLGCGPKVKKDWLNVDGIQWGEVDVVWNLEITPYEFIKEQVEEIKATECLEHISWRKSLDVVKEWYRILKDGGKLTIQVPDCGKMMEMYLNKEVCDCVPHKVEKSEDYKAKENCWNCQGKGKVNPLRWLFAFTGAQKYEYDIHRNIFTKDSLESLLKQAGFSKIKFKDNIYKLIVVCQK